VKGKIPIGKGKIPIGKGKKKHITVTVLTSYTCREREEETLTVKDAVYIDNGV